MFAASFTPSLVPRAWWAQGLVSASCAIAGYLLGNLVRWIWNFLELPWWRGHLARALWLVGTVVCIALVMLALWQAAAWQDSIRLRMGMESESRFFAPMACLLAVVLFVILLMLGRLFAFVLRWVDLRTRRFLPRRVALLLSIALTLALFWSIGNGVFFRLWLKAADSSYRQYDELVDEHTLLAALPERTRGYLTATQWKDIGRRGRDFLATGPTAAQIADFYGADAKAPIRVYVGLRSAETARARAALALDQLKQAHAFNRAALIVMTPTGSGWIDPGAVDSVEYLMRGDVASVTVQYSYLSSPLSLLTEPEYGAETSRELFRAIYGYWHELPHDRRPRLYLHGLSLGAMNSERSTEWLTLLGDPFDGAMWSGPPFPSELWQWFTAHRNPGSPAWLPTYGDGTLVRFVGQEPLRGESAAGHARIAYLQYATDAIAFYSHRYFLHRPDWLDAPRGPEVSPAMRWFPLVTGIQLVFDMPAAINSPEGHGHAYAPASYVDAWAVLLDRHDDSPETIARLKRRLTQAAGDHAL
ncbi:hypothetical protein EYV96_16090 [Dyella terrae]|uniref:Alpha/beta-hydrolase family protein n=3 Tax=Rhodanobacteraceae TaxID=1775411 RepID=A0A4V6N9W1_9GAMM|nr:hypothetical protein EYV96_16090 [Dyella terrae]TCI06268.1 hypothetical protein EZM97_35180 [Dyella soli]